jgi:hypothetical protein
VRYEVITASMKMTSAIMCRVVSNKFANFSAVLTDSIIRVGNCFVDGGSKHL